MKNFIDSNLGFSISVLVCYTFHNLSHMPCIFACSKTITSSIHFPFLLYYQYEIHSYEDNQDFRH